MEPVTGSWGPQNLAMYAQAKFFEYPIPASGEYSVSVSTTGLQSTGAPDIMVINKNGTNVDPNASTDPPNRSYTGNFAAGDILSAEVFVMAARTNVTASWTITSNVIVDPGDPGDPVDPVEPEGVIEVEEIDMIYFGGDEAEALYKGTLLVWEALSGPLSEAAIYLDFESSANFLKNKGVSQDIIPSVNLEGTVPFYNDHAQFRATGLLSTPVQSTWDDGYTFTAWVRNIASGSGWRTILHRAKRGLGPYTNETYIVFNTTGSDSIMFSGLKHGTNHRESSSSVPISAGSDWTHVGVRWRRVSSTTRACAFFINGQFISESNLTGFSSSNTYAPDENELRLGGDFNGDADDIALWQRPLTNDEITQVYNQGRSYVPQITTAGLADFRLGEYYYFTFAADFSVESWSATGLPAGITMNPSAGSISGTPTTESFGTMTVTATGSGGLSAQKSFSWSVSSIPPLTVRTITANGSKVSHSGWAKPNLTWSIVPGSGGTYNKDGTLVMFRGKGKVRFTATLTTARRARIVSNLKGVLVTSNSSLSSHDLLSGVWVFEEAERIHVEIENYSGNANDRLSLNSEP